MVNFHFSNKNRHLIDIDTEGTGVQALNSTGTRELEIGGDSVNEPVIFDNLAGGIHVVRGFSLNAIQNTFTKIQSSKFAGIYSTLASGSFKALRNIFNSNSRAMEVLYNAGLDSIVIENNVVNGKYWTKGIKVIDVTSTSRDLTSISYNEIQNTHQAIGIDHVDDGLLIGNNVAFNENADSVQASYKYGIGIANCMRTNVQLNEISETGNRTNDQIGIGSLAGGEATICGNIIDSVDRSIAFIMGYDSAVLQLNKFYDSDDAAIALENANTALGFQGAYQAPSDNQWLGTHDIHIYADSIVIGSDSRFWVRENQPYYPTTVVSSFFNPISIDTTSGVSDSCDGNLWSSKDGNPSFRAFRLNPSDSLTARDWSVLFMYLKRIESRNYVDTNRAEVKDWLNDLRISNVWTLHKIDSELKEATMLCSQNDTSLLSQRLSRIEPTLSQLRFRGSIEEAMHFVYVQYLQFLNFPSERNVFIDWNNLRRIATGCFDEYGIATFKAMDLLRFWDTNVVYGSNCTMGQGKETVPALENFGGQVLIYPNPASNALFIYNQNPFVSIEKMTISDLFGRTFIQTEEISAQILESYDISFLPSGAYVVSYKQHGRDFHFKFVIVKS